MTSEQLNELIQRSRSLMRRNPDLVRPASCAEPEPVVREKSLAPVERKEAHPARYRVRVVSFRRRLLDPDNLCVKYFIDAIRYAGLIPGDAPEDIELQLSQEKVKSKEEELTQITIHKI